MASVLDAVEWRQARQWLISSGVIPPTHAVTKPDVDLVDFARSLRDGVFLCSLLNTLKPGCITDWNPKPLMQHSYLKNISVFLMVCQTKFKVKEVDIFAQSDLYDVDNFKKVMHLLSKLSHTPEALTQGWVPFPREETRDYYNEVNNDDIYASLHDIAMTSERLYANMEDLYSDVPKEDPYGYGDESIYDSICYYQAPPLKVTDADEKKKYVLEELLETERSFLTVLEIISQDFYLALKDHLSPDDLELLFALARSLYPVHKCLLDGFERGVEQKSNPGKSEFTQTFINEQKGLLQYGMYAARLPMAVEKAKQLQNRSDMTRILQQCQDRSNQRFPLSDLLAVPIQRFLKYPLLVKEVHKCAKKGAMPSQAELGALEFVTSMLEDIAMYINATKGDFESMRGIEEVEQTLVDYRGPSLLECGRYHLDGELRFKQVDTGGQPKSSKWAFLFDKVMLLCKKIPYKFFDVRYQTKQWYSVSDLRVEPVQSAHRGKFSCAFKLVVQGQCEMLAYAKTEELKSQWIDAINHAREVIGPREGRRGHHLLQLQTFDQPCYCSVCKKLLHGCYFQGYSCSVCNQTAHRDCLRELEKCSTAASAAAQSLPLSTSRHPTLMPTVSVDFDTRSRKPSKTATISNERGQIYVAKQRYEAIGIRSNRILSFEKGEELEVLNAAANSDWWEAISLRTGNKGDVPASYLVKKFGGGAGEDGEGVDQMHRHSVGATPLPSFSSYNDPTLSPRSLDERLRAYTWYVGKKSRIEAEQALHRMKDGVFLIRESDMRPGEFAIALKWNKMPKHIKISKHPDTRKFYVSDVCEFLSVEELVAYYQQNSLGSSFPGVDTTLRYPYKDVAENSEPPIPAGESWAEVLFTFVAEFPDELTIEKHDWVRVVSKDTNKLGWWQGECHGRTGLFPSNYVREH